MAKGNQGISSNKLVRPAVQTGAAASGINKGAASQIGASQGNKITDKTGTVSGGVEAYKTASPYACKLGNEVALNSKSAPGQGRTIYKTGTQMTHGEVNRGEGTVGRGKDILSEYGPERGHR
jgi:hypothetical protein